LIKVKNLKALLVNQKAVEKEILLELRFEMNAEKYSGKLPPCPQVKCLIEK